MSTTIGGPTAEMRAPLSQKLLWVTALYLSQGLPFGLLNEMLPIYFRTEGVSLTEIGVLALIGLPWSLKFWWAPLVDRVGTRKQWILATQLAFAAGMALLAFIPVEAVSLPLWGLLFTLAMISATQDIAIDAKTLTFLDRDQMGPANGVRVTAYRVAMIIAGGVLVGISGFIGWRATLLTGAALMLALVWVTRGIPRDAGRAEAASEPIWEPLRELLAMPASWAVVLFALTFKLGDVALLPMVRPLWVDRGFSTEEIGLVLGTVGMLATIAGALTGGVLTAKLGTFRALWMLGLVQAASNLGYWLAEVSGASFGAMTAAAVTEQFTSGLGTASFLTFLMTLCTKKYAASQYALLSALFAFGRSIAGSLSGVLTERMGYADYFLVTFLLAFPAFLLLPWVGRALRARS